MTVVTIWSRGMAAKTASTVLASELGDEMLCQRAGIPENNGDSSG